MPTESPYPIGTPGVPWQDAERVAWRKLQRCQRSYADDVLSVIDTLAADFEVIEYGHIDHGDGVFPLRALRTRAWVQGRPAVLVTGGVHGYETSGIRGALAFLQQAAARYASCVNLLVAPCVSPWAYERIHRWNAQALDPNRCFRADSPAAESAALMQLVAPLQGQWLLHVDLHETTDTDESEFRPALAARDGRIIEPGEIPDGFYLVADQRNPQLPFQQAVVSAVAAVTHIAPADRNGQIIGAPVVAPGVILYPFRDLGLCAGVTDAAYCTTTEVYPDSPQVTPERCVQAQVTAICAAIDYLRVEGVIPD